MGDWGFLPNPIHASAIGLGRRTRAATDGASIGITFWNAPFRGVRQKPPYCAVIDKAGNGVFGMLAIVRAGTLT